MPTIIIGELIPWKGAWWEIVDVDVRGRILLNPRKQTTGKDKRDAAEKRWRQQHPNATNDRHGIPLR